MASISKPKQAYFLKVGPHRIPFMELKESAKGDQYVVFPMNRRGFHLSAHPKVNPHMKDNTGFRQDLDLQLLRQVDWEAEAQRFKEDLEARAYWPNHRADIIAIPGPRGKSIFEAIRDLTEGGEGNLDTMRYLKVVLGSGTIYKVGPKEREAFFRSKIGRGALLFDKKEECAAVYGPFFPERPLLRFGGRFGTIRTHPHLELWKAYMDANIDLEWEEVTPEYRVKMEEAFEKMAPQMEAFARKLKVVRWKPKKRIPPR